MSKEVVIKQIESVIKITAREIKRNKTVKSDQMRQLTGFINAYTRLLLKSEEIDNLELNGNRDYNELQNNFQLEDGEIIRSG